jgi:hypothetical protein
MGLGGVRRFLNAEVAEGTEKTGIFNGEHAAFYHRYIPNVK